MTDNARPVESGSTTLSFPPGLAGAARVRTPGKYIIVFGVLPVLLFAWVIAMTVANKARYQSPFAIELARNATGTTVRYYPLPELLVDLAPDREGRVAFLKADPAIELASDTDVRNRTLDEVRPLLSERLHLFLRLLEPDDLRGPENMVRVKDELTQRINLVLGTDAAQDVVLQNLVIQ